ncbi:phospholipase A2 inhibitor and Ly6/PLAUR domain-containing protein-like [Trichomycterus rosablanca]|uniref:phospholipase A2 inhibitor and Ly6/PLAUR domain-containing protein-like n=1 Tax=Trichomycterus rosablanca TaxID=2290929 RepID=UPI002F35B4B4
MKSQVALLLSCLFFNKALALKCNQCTPTSPTTSCSPVTPTDCSGTQCASITASVIAAGVKTDVNVKTCGAPDECATQSLNLGLVKVTSNAKCCSTDLCNTDAPPALIQSANGKRCYTCDSSDCSKTVNCEGIEDRCITATVEQGGNKIAMKGCVSKNVCDAASGSSLQGIAVTKLTCCEGNLCNGAETFTLSFLILLVPLLSSILLH